MKQVGKILSQMLSGPHLSGNLVKKYGHTYLRLLSDGVDGICRWIYKLRETFDKQRQNVFDKCKYIACPA